MEKYLKVATKQETIIRHLCNAWTSMWYTRVWIFWAQIIDWNNIALTQVASKSEHTKKVLSTMGRKKASARVTMRLEKY